MASTSISNPDLSASRSREGESKRKKRRKLEAGEVNEGIVESDRTRWRTATEQQIYSSKLFEALRQVRRNDSPVIGGRTVRDTADRVLAVAAKGKSRWSRAILTSRLSLRLNQINRKHRRAKAIAKGNVTGDSKLKKPAVKKKLPALQKKVRVLSRLVPGCRKLSFPNLLEETTDYISALEMQIRAMSVLTELLNGTGAGVGAGLSADQSNWLGSNHQS